MTLQDASARLAGSVEELWAAVGELVLIVAEDQPRGPGPGGLAVADDLLEAASEVQGDVAAARALLVPEDPAAFVRRLPDVAGHLTAAARRHRGRFLDHPPVARLRSAAHRRGGEWPSWQRSVELTARRCGERADDCGDALLACWREVVQILVPPPDLTAPTAGARTGAPPNPSRRVP